jgi:hypothetical protein
MWLPGARPIWLYSGQARGPAPTLNFEKFGAYANKFGIGPFFNWYGKKAKDLA